MEHDFKRPKVGDEFHIIRRYDKGGYPVIRVLKVRTVTMLVQDVCEDGTTGHLDHSPRDFRDKRGWPKLREHWRRHKANSPSTNRDGRG